MKRNGISTVTDFIAEGNQFQQAFHAKEMFEILKQAEQTMDAEWLPSIKGMIGAIDWKKYENHVLEQKETEVLKMLKEGGIAEWEGKIALAAVKRLKEPLLARVYRDYFADVKEVEDKRMRSTTSGMQIYVGSSGSGFVRLSYGDGYQLLYRMNNAESHVAERVLTLRNQDTEIAVPQKIIDLSVFGPLVQDLLSLHLFTNVFVCWNINKRNAMCFYNGTCDF